MSGGPEYVSRCMGSMSFGLVRNVDRSSYRSWTASFVTVPYCPENSAVYPQDQAPVRYALVSCNILFSQSCPYVEARRYIVQRDMDGRGKRE